MAEHATSGGSSSALLDLYDEALPSVYGYLLRRCGQVGMAEELTAETFLAAVDAVRRDEPPPLSVAWLVGVARHKLVDQWRRQAREQAGLTSLADVTETHEDPWETQLDAVRARATLDTLAPHHRAVLTLRYLDDLPVKEVAFHLNRTPHATEGLLARAREAFRRSYSIGDRDDA